MRNNGHRLHLLACLVLGLSGCLNSPDMRVENSITLTDLSQEIQKLDGDIQYFSEFPSIGRFPTGIAVARLTKETVTTDQRTQDVLKLQPLKDYEVIYWTELFDGTPEVRETVPVREKSFRDEYVTYPELFRAAKVGNHGLLLVYGYDNSSIADTCCVVGLLYESLSGAVVAVIRGTMSLSEAREQVEELPKYARPKSARDWAFYIDHLAFRDFEKKFRRCVWNLIDHDLESEELQPNPYTTPEATVLQSWPSQ